MGKELIIDGESSDFSEDTTVAELKEEAGFSADGTVRYDNGEEDEFLRDDQTVEDIPAGSNVSSQPAKGKLFG